MLKLILAGVPALVLAQTMSIEDYKPKSTLVVPQHLVTRAKYPFIDVHNLQNSEMPVAQLDKLVKDMDGINLQVMVNLSGGSWGRRFRLPTPRASRFFHSFLRVAAR